VRFLTPGCHHARTRRRSTGASWVSTTAARKLRATQEVEDKDDQQDDDEDADDSVAGSSDGEHSVPPPLPGFRSSLFGESFTFVAVVMWLKLPWKCAAETNPYLRQGRRVMRAQVAVPPARPKHAGTDP